MDKTLLKGLAVLEAIAEMQGEARVIDDVAARVGLTRSNTHRTLQTLIHAGYVERDPAGGGFRSTTKMYALGVRQLGQLDLRKIAPSFMAVLAGESAETVHLSVLEGQDVIYVDKIDSIQPIRAYSMIGGRAPPTPWPRARPCSRRSLPTIWTGCRNSCRDSRRTRSRPGSS